MAKKTEKRPKSKARKIIEWVLTGLFILVFGAVAGFQIYSVATRNDNYGVPNLFGVQTMVVLTDSMEPEYPVGSAVFAKKVDPSEIQIDDDVTFFYSEWNMVVTHRVSKIETYTDTSGNITYTFTAHGINTNSNQCKQAGGDTDCTWQTQRFGQEYLLGKVVGKSNFVGWVYQFISSWVGLLILLLIPCLYLIITSVIDMARAIKDPDEENGEVVSTQDGDNNSPNNDVLKNLSEEDKKRLKEDLLNEMLEKKNGGDK